jgi:basic membrane protein A
MTKFTTFLGASALALMAGTAFAQDAGPAVIFDLGGKFDKSFNEAAFNGAERWSEETGQEYAEFELTAEAQREQAIRRFAEAGNNPVIMVGLHVATPLSDIAPDYPDTKFVIVDAVVEPAQRPLGRLQRARGLLPRGPPRRHGRRVGTVGFVGGMDIPLIRKFGCGYAQGVMAANPDATVSPTSPAPPRRLERPARGSELTLRQIGQGADVIFAAAGGTGVGVLQTAADEGSTRSAWTRNQNYMHPGLGADLDDQARGQRRLRGHGRGRRRRDGRAGHGRGQRGRGLRRRRAQPALITPEMQPAVDEAAAQIASASSPSTTT